MTSWPRMSRTWAWCIPIIQNASVACIEVTGKGDGEASALSASEISYYPNIYIRCTTNQPFSSTKLRLRGSYSLETYRCGLLGFCGSPASGWRGCWFNLLLNRFRIGFPKSGLQIAFKPLSNRVPQTGCSKCFRIAFKLLSNCLQIAFESL